MRPQINADERGSEKELMQMARMKAGKQAVDSRREAQMKDVGVGMVTAVRHPPKNPSCRGCDPQA
jgi:hypothetical protein